MGSKNVTHLFLFIFLISSQFYCCFSAQTWIRAGYWYAGSEYYSIPNINSALFTHLICAYADLNSSTYQLSIPSSQEPFFSSFTGVVKRKNPSLITLLSIWNGQAATNQSMLGEKANSSVLSSMASKPSNRKSFIESSIKTARLYGFQGIDLSWLWPRTTSDMINMGKLLDEWGAAVNSESRNSSDQSRLILTMAVRYLPAFESLSYPIESMKRNLDWAHVVAFDYHLSAKENVTGAHAALYEVVKYMLKAAQLPYCDDSQYFVCSDCLHGKMHKLPFPTDHVKYSRAATNNFSSENKLGEGGFGPVYMGKLRGGHEIAVKRLSKTSTQGLEEFRNEVTLTARLQHVNLVRVLGFCTEKEEKMLIYEYMPNKSLDFYLFDPTRRHLLDWTKLVHIIEGVTQGLLYLQEYSNFTIIHRDLKGINILLDHEMNAKISDFGMAKLFRKDELEANTSRIVGTYGYVPPEYVRKGIYSMKYDVYSFGVLLLQMISGRRSTCYYGPNESLHLLQYAYLSWKEDKGREFIDPSLDDSSSSCKLSRCLQVALLCVQENPEDRPTMLEVYCMLKTDTEPIPTPTKMAFSGNRSMENISTSQQGSCSVNDAEISELQPR